MFFCEDRITIDIVFLCGIILPQREYSLLNKNKFRNKIIAIGGIAGGIGSTTIAMNMSDLISKNVPNKNLLYIASYTQLIYF